MTHLEHQELAKDVPVTVAVLTVSDTRTQETDKSGPLMQSYLVDAGHRVHTYRIVPDEPEEIRLLIEQLVQHVEVILLNGGTGISRRDTTFETITAMLEKQLPGFGEIFRVLSYEEIGAAAMLSRATAGVYQDTLIFSTPGSSNAVKLAMEKLIVPQLQHLVWEIIRQPIQ